MPSFKKFDLNKQSVEVPGTRTPGATGHYRHAGFADELVDNIRADPTVKTLYDLFQSSLVKFQDKDMLGSRNYDPVTKSWSGYNWQSYRQVDQRTNAFGSGVMHINEAVLGGTQLNRWSLGIWSLNRPEWFISEMICNYYNLVSVPLYETLGPDAVEYVMNHAEIKIAVVSGNHVASLLEMSDKLPHLRAIISMDSLAEGAPAPGVSSASSILRAWSNDRGIKIYDFQQVEALGREYPRRHIPPQPEEAHIMGRVIDTNSAYSGCRIGYFRGDLLLLMDDIVELKPTFFPTVPRLLNRIYAKVVASTVDAPGLVGKLARRGVATKLANLEAGKGVTHPLWDRLLFNKVKMALGGNVQAILTGSAPIAKEVLNFLRIAFGCTILEGYGATEGMATATITMADEHQSGIVGCPRAGVELKLADVPEMNYFATDKPFPRGEIMIRGATVFKGYYKDEKNTLDTIDNEGWLKSGDIGFIDNRGCLTIIDRKKNIFKLAQGEYIAPEKIENVLQSRCNLVMQIYVHGDSLESTLVCIAIPDPETFLPFANSIAGTKVTMADGKGLAKLLKDPKVKTAYLKELEKAGQAGGLRGFEIVKRVHLSMDMFSVENNMMTPTSKVRRPQVKEYFLEDIKGMYEDIHSTTVVAKL
ncbi:hypothetical protein KI688_006495 [Linnemannia hyalina]|uniref:AMP-dependent synthetase/ligase domain-containing protein n=1 Tax=Linnemannia hyalina TaxID=64524 RepID=A0A9P7XKH7_9FUNG|nr:hypothetical protein KI688_006495 [Linnemannia hyalina]